MLRLFKCLLGPALTAFVFATLAAAQTPQHPPHKHSPPPHSHPQSGVATLRAGTQLVVVDVVVTDKNQKPVHGLKASDFTLTEENVPQSRQALRRAHRAHSSRRHEVPAPAEISSWRLHQLHARARSTEPSTSCSSTH